MYTKVCSKMKESVSSAFYMGTLKMQGDLRKHYAKHLKPQLPYLQWQTAFAREHHNNAFKARKKNWILQ